MTLSASDIKLLIADFQASDWEEIAIVDGDLSVVISRSAGSPWIASSLPRPDDASAGALTPVGGQAVNIERQNVAPTISPPLPPPSGSSGVALTERSPAGHAVTSPTVGLCWRSPQPGSPPFVEVGQHVEANDTVCIIEVMKLMNHVKAGVAGTISRFETENGAMVEHGTVLLFLDPDV